MAFFIVFCMLIATICCEVCTIYISRYRTHEPRVLIYIYSVRVFMYKLYIVLIIWAAQAKYYYKLCLRTSDPAACYI